MFVFGPETPAELTSLTKSINNRGVLFKDQNEILDIGRLIESCLQISIVLAV